MNMDPATFFLEDPDFSTLPFVDVDDGWEEALFDDDENQRPKNEDYLDTVARYSDEQFREHFRVTRRIAESLADRFAGSTFFCERSGRYGKLTPYEQILIFCWFAGHQTASYRDVADRFNITISSLFRVNERVIYFVSSLADEFIRWPSIHERSVIAASFRAKGFPGVIGAVDGTHIKLDKPAVDPDSYCNRKKYFSMQVQAVCDHNLKVRDVFIGFPGSVHDARVFGRSDLGQNLREMCGEHVILGDSAYPCLRNLITPFKDLGNLTRAHKTFNRTLSSCRSVIEHFFGLLKQRFRQLYHCKLRSMRTIAHFIRACCVLHNMIVDENSLDPYMGDSEGVHSEDEGDSGTLAEDSADTREGVAYREFLLRTIVR